MKGKDGINIILAACFIENLNCLRAQHLPCSSNQCRHDKKKIRNGGTQKRKDEFAILFKNHHY